MRVIRHKINILRWTLLLCIRYEQVKYEGKLFILELYKIKFIGINIKTNLYEKDIEFWWKQPVK